MPILSRRKQWQAGQNFAPAPGGGGGGYTAQGIKFNGAPYLTGTTNTNFTGAVDGTSFLISFWFKMQGSDGSFQTFIDFDDSGTGVGLNILKYNDNTIHLDTANTAASGVCRTVSTAFTSGGGWHHYACAYNAATPLLYIDGVSNGTPSNFGGTIDFTPGATNYVGSRGGSLTLNADIADLYVAYNQFLDISVAANLQKFRSSGGSPVDLGATGSTPTGTAPTVYLSGAVASWHVNKGTGGNLFTVTSGPLTAATTNPP